MNEARIQTGQKYNFCTDLPNIRSDGEIQYCRAFKTDLQTNLSTSYFQIDCWTGFQGEMILLDDNLMEKEEKKLRKLLPISVLLHNCLVLALSKESLITSLKKRKTQLFAQDGVDRDFWKFGSLLLCHDKSELNFDKFLLFNDVSISKKEERDALKQELQRWKILSTNNICQYLFAAG